MRLHSPCLSLTYLAQHNGLKLHPRGLERQDVPFLTPNDTPLHMWAVPFYPLVTAGSLGVVPILAIVNDAVTSLGVYLSPQDPVFTPFG